MFPSATPNTDRFQRTPLKKFTGTLKELPRLVKNEQNDRQRAVFDFTDVIVIESDEPYPFPIVTIEIGYSPEGKNNGWDVFKNSMYKLFNDTEYSTMFERLVGKEQTWWYGDCEIRRPASEAEGEDKDANGKDIWKLRPSKAWQITWLEGAESATQAAGKPLNEALVDLLDGKTDSDFYAAMFSDQSLRAYGTEYTKAVEAAAQRKLVEGLVTLGLVTQDADGIYHKVGN